MPHPREINYIKNIIGHAGYDIKSAAGKYPLISYVTTPEDHKKNELLMTAAAAHAAMSAKIPSKFWKYHVLNLASFNDYSDDLQALYKKSFLPTWNGLWIILSHGSPGHIKVSGDLEARLTASEFYSKYGYLVMDSDAYKATLIGTCSSGKSEQADRGGLQKRGDENRRALPFIEELQGFSKRPDKPIIAAGARMTCLFPRDSKTHTGYLCIEPINMIKEYKKVNRQNELSDYFKVDVNEAEKICSDLWRKQKKKQSASIVPDKKEDTEKIPLKDAVTGLTGYGYQDCLTEKFYQEKAINIGTLMDELVPSANKKEETDENEEKKDSLSSDILNNIHKLLHKTFLPKTATNNLDRFNWFCTSPIQKFPVKIDDKQTYDLLIKMDKKRKEIYVLVKLDENLNGL